MFPKGAKVTDVVMLGTNYILVSPVVVMSPFSEYVCWCHTMLLLSSCQTGRTKVARLSVRLQTSLFSAMMFKNIRVYLYLYLYFDINTLRKRKKCISGVDVKFL